MNHPGTLIPSERIERAILLIRNHKVMLDSDLADLYGVPTKRLNEQVKRNRDRFPDDFVFQLTAEEKAKVVAICDHLQKIKFSPVLPYAFTEHGALMAASVLNSPVAIQVSIEVVRTFNRLRRVLAAHQDLARKIEELEQKFEGRLQQHDALFLEVFEAIRQLMIPPDPKAKQIGFLP